MDTDSKIPVSKLKRTAITGITAARLGAKHVGYKARSLVTKPENKAKQKQQHEEQIGDIIFSVLTQLRGTALKVSQILSMEADVLPLSIRQKLKEACYQVPPINRALVRKQIVHEFGSHPQDLFRQFNSSAFAAASIGQVHRAITFDGEPVAVKIQYPGIANTIESDLKIIEKLFSGLSKASDLLPQKHVLEIMMTEMQDRLREEVDYQNEADNIKWFKSNVEIPGIVIPRVIDSLSRKRVLSLEMLEGHHLTEWLATNPSQRQRNAVGQQLFDYFWYCVLELKRINADLHPGNFLVLENEDIGALDFGCVRDLSDLFIDHFVELIPALIDVFENSKSPKKLLSVYQSLRVVSKDVSPEQFEQEMLGSIEPFGRWLIEAYAKEEFDFSRKQPCPGKPTDSSLKLVKQVDGFFHEQLCFDRAHLGLMNLLTEIGAVVKTDWLKYRSTESR